MQHRDRQIWTLLLVKQRGESFAASGRRFVPRRTNFLVHSTFRQQDNHPLDSAARKRARRATHTCCPPHELPYSRLLRFQQRANRSYLRAQNWNCPQHSRIQTQLSRPSTKQHHRGLRLTCSDCADSDHIVYSHIISLGSLPVVGAGTTPGMMPLFTLMGPRTTMPMKPLRPQAERNIV